MDEKSNSILRGVVGTVYKGVPRNDQERVSQWQRWMRGVATKAQDVGNAGMVEEAQCYKNAIEGGDCPRCGTSWERVVVDNLFSLGERFRPTCDCLPLWVETEENITVHRKDGTRTSKRFSTPETTPMKYFAMCDRCGAGVELDHRRRILNLKESRFEGARSQYEKVLCYDCLNPKKKKPKGGSA